MTDPKPPLVYGLTPFHCGPLAVLPEQRAVRLADEIDAIKDCATYGGLRVVEPTLTLCRAPVDEDELKSAPDDAPFRWDESQDWLRGAWPPLPTSAQRST